MIDEQVVILAIESSGNVCSAGLSIDGKLTALYESIGYNLHDKLLAEYVHRILSDLMIDFSSIDAVAVGSGPGSFTGLRIGASLAKGMTFGGKPKLIAVPHLTALAESSSQTAALSGFKKIISAIKSHKNFIYLQMFDLEINPLTEVMIIPQEELTPSNYRDAFLTGVLSPASDGFVSLSNLNQLSSAIILKTAQRLFENKIYTDTESYSPQYFQDFSPTIKSNKDQ